ncbi:MAG TPA: hypothetical protein DEQ61_12975 [Streptomyces sp.]|nr:hypothetical protein [Streptomyces sp.]
MPGSVRERGSSPSNGLSARYRVGRAADGRPGHLERQYALSGSERAGLRSDPDGFLADPSLRSAEHVDHDHETGKVRDMLCSSRDAAYGQFRDRPEVMRRAAAYVEGNVWKPTLVAPGVYQLPS